MLIDITNEYSVLQ